MNNPLKKSIELLLLEALEKAYPDRYVSIQKEYNSYARDTGRHREILWTVYVADEKVQTFANMLGAAAWVDGMAKNDIGRKYKALMTEEPEGQDTGLDMVDFTKKVLGF